MAEELDPATVPLVDEMPALTRVAFAPEVVSQSLEGLLVYLALDGSARSLRPIHTPSLRVGWRREDQPAEVMLRAAARYGLTPLLVHSTSWRFEDARVVLTYVVAVAPPASASPWLADEPVARAELARGDATAPPPSIDVPQVLEHAFRHLSWLVKDDEKVREALPDWTAFLDDYEPEPFRAFGGPPGG